MFGLIFGRFVGLAKAFWSFVFDFMVQLGSVNSEIKFDFFGVRKQEDLSPEPHKNPRPSAVAGLFANTAALTLEIEALSPYRQCTKIAEYPPRTSIQIIRQFVCVSTEPSSQG